MKLVNKTRNQELATDVKVGDDFYSRAIGRMGTKSFDVGHALWIRASWYSPCNSIHTFFMRYPLDAIFVDRALVVKAVYQELKPWRMTKPIAGAVDVIELPGGTLKSLKVEVGDQLHVGD